MMHREIADHIGLLILGPKRHSYQAIAEQICEHWPGYIDFVYGEYAHRDLYGNQLLGMELVHHACRILDYNFHKHL